MPSASARCGRARLRATGVVRHAKPEGIWFHEEQEWGIGHRDSHPVAKHQEKAVGHEERAYRGRRRLWAISRHDSRRRREVCLMPSGLMAWDRPAKAHRASDRASDLRRPSPRSPSSIMCRRRVGIQRMARRGTGAMNCRPSGKPRDPRDGMREALGPLDAEANHHSVPSSNCRCQKEYIFGPCCGFEQE